MYLVFAGSNYYPSGGWRDYLGTFNSENEALKAIANLSYSVDWWQIVFNNVVIEEKIS
jgi:hypothetical protein